MPFSIAAVGAVAAKRQLILNNSLALAASSSSAETNPFSKILSFNETTSHEMEDNLKRLGENNIKGLVFDLRENPGGLLNEGVAVADHFLQKGQTVVSHRGQIGRAAGRDRM